MPPPSNVFSNIIHQQKHELYTKKAQPEDCALRKLIKNKLL